MIKRPGPELKAYGPVDFGLSISSAGPFESTPHVAVACSGGADSLALTLLADEWAREAGGRATALIVDHAMRPESADEAVSVRDRLAAVGIEAVVLTRRGPALKSDRQAAARQARYAQMTEWCRRAGVLHLLLGHHRGDQAETLMLRLGRGSGVDGLAAMAAVSENPNLRILRPLLDVPRERLVAYLRFRGLDWVEDPSNEDSAYARVRMRRLLPVLGREGFTESRLAATARRMARARTVSEEATTGLLARTVAIYPEGYATLALGDLLAAPDDIGLRALSRLLTCVGGNRHGPRMEHLERLHEWLSHGAGVGRTLAGCRITRRADGSLLIFREAAEAPDMVPATGNMEWDGRFRLTTDGPPGARLARLGPNGWGQIKDIVNDLHVKGLPVAVRNAIPAIWRLEEVVAVPHLHYCAVRLERPVDSQAELAFLPTRLLGAARFVAAPALA